MQQKMQFVATILHEPSLLILDEPCSGLDPINSELLREIIFELKEEGRTILFASHRMEQLCDDICLMAKGKILVNGPLGEIKRGFGRDAINLEFEGDGAFLDVFEARGCIRITSRSKHRAAMRLLPGARARDILDAALALEGELYRFELEEPSLTEIFITVVGQQDAQTEGA